MTEANVQQQQTRRRMVGPAPEINPAAVVGMLQQFTQQVQGSTPPPEQVGAPEAPLVPPEALAQPAPAIEPPPFNPSEISCGCRSSADGSISIADFPGDPAGKAAGSSASSVISIVFGIVTQ